MAKITVILPPDLNGDLRLNNCPLTRAIAEPRGVQRAPQGITLPALWSGAATAGRAHSFWRYCLWPARSADECVA